MLNPQSQTRFARHKLQGRFAKEFATRKAVMGWLLNIWGGDLQALCRPCLGYGDTFFSTELGPGLGGTVGNNCNHKQVIIAPFPKEIPLKALFIPCSLLCPACLGPHRHHHGIGIPAPSFPATSPSSDLPQPGNLGVFFTSGEAKEVFHPLSLPVTSFLLLLQ